MLYASNVRVEPMSTDSVTQLNTDCPCGGVWRLREPRTLHECPPRESLSRAGSLVLV